MQLIPRLLIVATAVVVDCVALTEDAVGQERGESDAVATSASVSQLAFISGCWANQRPGRVTEEHWTLPAGGTLLGVNRTIRDGRTVAHEFLQIREVAPDTLGYIAEPSGQTRTVFRMTNADASSAVFENPKHDFPQRIAYKLSGGGDSLLVRVEANRNGDMVGFDLRLARMTCHDSF